MCNFKMERKRGATKEIFLFFFFNITEHFLTHSFLFWPISFYLCEIRHLCPPVPAALSCRGNITLHLNGNLKTGPQPESPSEKETNVINLSR